MSYGQNSDSIKILAQEIGSLDSNALLNLFTELRKKNDSATAKLLWKFRLATDLELFAIAYFPHYCQHAFNEFHHDVFDSTSFMERAIRRVRGAPRGYAKSTLTALIKPIHDVCYSLEKFIVIVSNTQEQSNQKLRDIRSEIFNNTALTGDYGIHFRTKTPAETSYILFCGDHSCMFASYGAGAEIRGIRYGSSRPSKIVADDSEHSEEVLNEALRTKYEDWWYQVISQIGDENTNIDFIGTVLHPESLLKRLSVNPAYNSKIYKAVNAWADNQALWQQWTKIYTNIDNDQRAADADKFYLENETEMLKGTKVLWPEKEPYLYLMKELVEKGRRAFMKEKQNEPIGGDDVVFDLIHWYRETSEGLLIESTEKLIPWSELKDKNGQWLNAYGALDPATGQTKARAGKQGDFSALPSGIKDHRGRLFVHEVWMKRAAPTKWISEVFEHHLQFNYQKFGVETNLYRDLLIPNLVAERKRREQETKQIIKIPFYDIENVDNKEKRIYTLEPKVTHGWILFNRAIGEAAIRQLEAFPHGEHDDFPDALEMLWGLVNNRYKAAALSLDPIGSR